MLLTSWRRLCTPHEGHRPLVRADVLRVLAPLGWRLLQMTQTGALNMNQT